MEDIKKYSEDLQRSLRELERALSERRGGYCEANGASAAGLELESKVRELTMRNEALGKELLSLQNSYDCLRTTCDGLLNKLNAAIELVKSILERE